MIVKTYIVPLSANERKAYRFIRTKIKEDGYPPTRQEIAKHLGIKSKYGRIYANNLLASIAEKGYVSLGEGQRNIAIIKQRKKI